MKTENPASPAAIHKTEQQQLANRIIVLAIAFFALLGGSYTISTHLINEQIYERSQLLARTAAAKDVELRDWMAAFGGVFVPVTEKTPPNPYLSPIGRELIAPDGRTLTKMNPAYVTRLLHERWGAKYGMVGHITSLQPIRPQNAAALWEKEALETLMKNGEAEYSTVSAENDKEVVRHMVPLQAKAGCLTCHTTQGYKIGDIMGGISNVVPTAQMAAGDRQLKYALLAGHAIVGLLMLLLFWKGGTTFVRGLRQRQQAETALKELADTLEEKVRQRTEELRQTQENTELILSSTFEGIVEVDNDGVITFINNAGREMSGYAPGDRLYDAFHTDGEVAPETGCTCPLCQCAQLAFCRFTNISMNCKDSSVLFIDGSTTSVYKDGEKVALLIVFHNISDYSRMENLQKLIFSASIEPMLIFSPRTLSACNQAALDFFGAESEEALCRDFEDFSPDVQENGQKTSLLFKACFDQCDHDGTARFNWLHRHADGSSLPCRVTMSKISHPLYSGYLASLHDQRATLRYEEKLKEERDLLNTILNASPMPMYIEDEEGIVRVANPAAEQILPLTVGHSSTPVWPDGHVLRALLQRSAAGTLTEPQAVRLNGKEKHAVLETRTNVVRVIHEGSKASLVWVQDISDLVNAKEQAERFSQAKSEFLARMSHEIRTPMNAILGMTYLFQQNPLEDWQKRYILKIQEASKGLLGIINDILDFSKIEAGKLELECAPFSLSELVENLSNICSPMAEDKKLELLFHISPELPDFFEGDILRISQVLTNLLSNAIKFTAFGEVVLRITELERHAPDVVLGIEVADSGIGMNEEQISRIFQPFEQADSSTTRRFGGTGLGLVICDQLVRMMGGRLTVQSVPNQGSTFSFSLRLKLHRLESAFRFSNLASSERVLVVDDNESARTIMRDMITSFGFQVDTVPSGSAACDRVFWEASSGTPYALVVLDWKMPGMDGFECAQHINELPMATPPKLLMISAHGLDEYNSKGNTSGFIDYISKPVTRSALWNALAKAMGREERSAARSKLGQSEKDVNLRHIKNSQILLVEDNETNQEVASKLLRRMGMTVAIAGNGLEAVNMCKAKRYDLVFMDIQMPVMDGLEAARRIRADEHMGEQVPIVAMTAHAMQSDHDKSLEAGMNAHITKPIDPDLLHTVLIKWIKPRDTGEATPELGAPLHVRASVPTSAPRPHASNFDDEDLQTLPFTLSGVDLDKGIRNVGNDAQSLLSHLRRFPSRYGDTCNALRQQASQGLWEEASRTAHTLKGVAATLGMLEVANTAAQLETNCRSQLFDPDQFNTLQQQLEALCAAITATVPETQEPAADTSDLEQDRATLRGNLQGLTKMMTTDVGGCMATVMEIRRCVPHIMSTASFKRLYDAVYELDAEAVQQAVDAALGELGGDSQ